MINLLLQLWGGAFYLLNKFFFSRAERSLTFPAQQRQRLWAWISYLAGLPPWVIIFVTEHNWIAAAVETSGVPAMLMGLNHARQGQSQLQAHPWLDRLARVMVFIGLTLSLYDFGGITTLNQWLELGVATGFLLGTYWLAKERPQGYFWLIVGNVTAALLMMKQGYFLLMMQQLTSLGFVFDAYWTQRQRIKKGMG